MSAKSRSGKNTPDATDDDVPPDIDSYPIDIPAAFIEAFDGATVAEKLRNAEAAPSTNGKEERGGCPECGSVRVHRKTGFDSQHEVDQPYRCTNCGAHVAELVPPAIGARDDTQLGLDVFNDDEPLYRNGEWLRAQYVDAELTVLQIADICKCDQSTVSTWLNKHGIDTRAAGDTIADERLRDGEWLRQQYVGDDQTAAEIAVECGCATTTVRRWLSNHEITKREVNADE